MTPAVPRPESRSDRKRDSERNAELLLGRPVPAAELPPALQGFTVPSWPRRFRERVGLRLGRLDGAVAGGPPRLLIRVDEFPYYDALDRPEHGNDASLRFNAVMAERGVHHLVGINANLVHSPLRPGAGKSVGLGPAEQTVIEEMKQSCLVTFGQHGTTHQTRYADPRRHSEFCGLPSAELAEVLDDGGRALAEVGVDPRVIVAPFNRFDATQWPVLSERFDVICGGPESVALLGFQGGPTWHGEAVYLPCYKPLYGRAVEVIPTLERIIAMDVGVWVPIALHSMWELEDDFAALRRLADLMGEYSVDWGELLEEIDRSRAAVG